MGSILLYMQATHKLIIGGFMNEPSEDAIRTEIDRIRAIANSSTSFEGAATSNASIRDIAIQNLTSGEGPSVQEAIERPSGLFQNTTRDLSEQDHGPTASETGRANRQFERQMMHINPGHTSR
ncbi:hypothetical protein KW800_00470 [Candidatus Parcubacteria bacterium]|nr:hypothetical protein [Candidatus Parcubacteria bacterium]